MNKDITDMVFDEIISKNKKLYQEFEQILNKNTAININIAFLLALKYPINNIRKILNISTNTIIQTQHMLRDVELDTILNYNKEIS